MIALREGDHIYDSIIQETGIDPYDRSEEIKVNQVWLLAKENLRRVSVGRMPSGSDIPSPDTTTVLPIVEAVERPLPRVRATPKKRASRTKPVDL
jgi:hypothetical protein